MKVKNQIISDRYAIYNGDCMDVLPTLEDSSVDLSIYSPLFTITAPIIGIFQTAIQKNNF